MLSNAAQGADGGGGIGAVLGFGAFGGLWLCVGKGRSAQATRSWLASLSGAQTIATGTAGPSRSQASADFDAAADLAATLRDGGKLNEIDSPFRLRTEERLFCKFEPVRLLAFIPIEVEYKTIHNRAAHPVGWMIDATIHKAINQRNKERAEAKAAATWREVANGALYLTSHRLILDDGLELQSWWYGDVAAASREPDGILLRIEDAAAIKLAMNQIHQVFVTLHFLAWGEVPTVGPAGSL